MVYLLSLLSYLAGFQRVSIRQLARPSNPDTMTNTALEDIGSSSGKWCYICYIYTVALYGSINENRVYRKHAILSQLNHNNPTYCGIKAADVPANLLAGKL